MGQSLFADQEILRQKFQDMLHRKMYTRKLLSNMLSSNNSSDTQNRKSLRFWRKYNYVGLQWVQRTFHVFLT